MVHQVEVRVRGRRPVSLTLAGAMPRGLKLVGGATSLVPRALLGSSSAVCSLAFAKKADCLGAVPRPLRRPAVQVLSVVAVARVHWPR